jgi:hemerythrin-like domain-containing protein
MIATLPSVTKEHHDRLIRHVDELPALGDLIGNVPLAELRPRVEDACQFLTGLLLPHMDAAEKALYPELERLMQNRHSMTPMRREHEEIRHLIGELERCRAALEAGRTGTGEAVAVRRVVFRLYGLLKVHLAEEQLYVDVIEHGISADADAALAAAIEHPGVALA